jgi:hypothetical protein
VAEAGRRFFWGRVGSGEPEPVEVALEGGKLVALTTRAGKYELAVSGCPMRVLGRWGSPLSLEEIAIGEVKDRIVPSRAVAVAPREG